jgi:RHS repeat-associated protein
VNYGYLADTHLETVIAGNDTYKIGYDALGRCVRRTMNDQTTYYIYDADKTILEIPDGDVAVAPSTILYGIGPDEIIGHGNNGVPQWLMQDRLGSVSAMLDGQGQVTEQYRYDAFGMPTFLSPGDDDSPGGYMNDTSLQNNRFLFTGREWVQSFGFYEYRARAYNPELGRFMSEDPLGIKVKGAKPLAAMMPNIAPGGVPASFASSESNLFTYCGNDPEDLEDPTGLEFFDEGYVLTSTPSGKNYGETNGRIEAQTLISKVGSGYVGHLIDIDLHVHSTIRTTAKQSSNPEHGTITGPDQFDRSPANIQRTIEHEGHHRGNNKDWYDANRKQVISSTNRGNDTYKTPEAAAAAVQERVDGAYRKFSKPDISHTSPAWNGWKAPGYELPVLVRPRAFN